MAALDGLRVLDISHVLAGPTASHYLSLLGADVIKVEKPGGGDTLRHGRDGALDEGISLSFAAVNAGKRSLAIDLKDPRMQSVLRRLVADADVFIENLRPGVIARLGFGREAVQAINPGIVYCSISGYGQQGAWSGRGAYDHVVQALTGMMSLNGSPYDPPVKVGFPVIDSVTGIFAAMAILAAVVERRTSGTGRTLDISMSDCALQLMLATATRVVSTGTDVPRVGNRAFSGSPGAATFACADGLLAVAASTEGQFRRLCDALGLGDMPDDPNLVVLGDGNGFVAARQPDEVHKRLQSVFSRASAAELETLLNLVDVPAARVRTLAEFLQESQAPGHVPVSLHRSQHPAGAFAALESGLGDMMDRGRAGQIPRLGSDTAGILRASGFGEEEIAALARDGTIALTEGAATGDALWRNSRTKRNDRTGGRK